MTEAEQQQKREVRTIFGLQILYLVVLVILLLSRRTHWLWVDRIPNPIGGVIPLGVPWFGALGAITIGLYGVFAHNAKWDSSYDYWHIARPAIGAVFGTMAYLIFIGIINATGANPSVQTHGPNAATGPDLIPYFVIAFVVGLREKTFWDLIKRVTDTILGPGIPGVTPLPKAVITPSPIELPPATAKGAASHQVVTISNAGAGSLVIGKKGVYVTGNPPQNMDVEGSRLEDAVIPAGGSMDIVVMMKTDQVGDFGGALVVPTNGGTASVPIKGSVT